MNNTILADTKKLIGLVEDDTTFDKDVIIFINTALSTLYQMGIGPGGGLRIIDGSETWDQITYKEDLQDLIKSYIYLRVRKLFDPPSTSFVLEAINSEIKELEWRIYAFGDETLAFCVPNDDEE